MIATNVSLKSVMHDRSTGLHVTNENTLKGFDVLYFDKVTVHAYGTKDVYYFNMSNGNMYVYRAKLDKIVRGCMFVRDREEYDTVYNWIKYQGFANMPENIFTALDRKYAKMERDQAYAE